MMALGRDRIQDVVLCGGLRSRKAQGVGLSPGEGSAELRVVSAPRTPERKVAEAGDGREHFPEESHGQSPFSP